LALVALAAILATAAGGCGTARPSVRRPAAAVYGGPAPLLVYFKRAVGFDPLASDLVVDRDGSSVATITLGGVSGQKRQAFTLAADPLRTLHRLIATTRLSDTACCDDAGYYLYLISTGGHTWRLEQRRVPRRARRLIDALNATLDAHVRY
jgi:hypothetical protein